MAAAGAADDIVLESELRCAFPFSPSRDFDMAPGAARPRTRPADRAEAARRMQQKSAGQSADVGRAGIPGQPDMRFALVPVDEAPKERRQRDAPRLPPAVERQKDVVLVSGSVSYTQRKGLPPSSQPGVSAMDAFFSQRPGQQRFTSTALDYLIPIEDPDYNGEVINITRLIPQTSRHHRKRLAQHLKWRDIVIPTLVSVFIAYKDGQQAHKPSEPVGCTCTNRTALHVQLADWDGMHTSFANQESGR